MPFFTNDLSVPYRQAQRDMSCRYTVGAYLDRTIAQARAGLLGDNVRQAYGLR